MAFQIFTRKIYREGDDEIVGFLRFKKKKLELCPQRNNKQNSEIEDLNVKNKFELYQKKNTEERSHKLGLKCRHSSFPCISLAVHCRYCVFFFFTNGEGLWQHCAVR